MIQFTKPLFLILLIPLGYYTYRLSRHSLADLSRFRSRLALGLRLAMLVMLVLCLAGVRMVRSVSQQCVVFALDVSDSISKSKQDQALAYINNALKNMKQDQKAALVVFGGDASVELSPSSLNKVEKIYSVPNTRQTDISQALGLALAVFPERSARKIVLLSDGNETRGKAIEQAMLAGSEDVSIDVVPIANELPHEALLDKIAIPNSVKVGEPFDLKAVAVSKEPSLGRIRIFRNGSPVAEKTVQLVKGKSVFTFQQSIPKAGNYEYQAILDSPVDTRSENNVALGYTMVSGKPKVLYVEGGKGQEKYLANALKGKDIEVDVRDRAGMPTSLAQLRGYDMVVLSDVPAWNLSPEQMSMINSGVKDLGIGFTMIGGENSFGAGGYFDTPIEEALPVDMSIRKSKVLPSLSVVVVMDKSGSMGAPEGGLTKIELANDAAASVVKLLQPIDKVGVIVCHDYPVVAVNLQPASNKDPIYGQISTIRAEGGGIAVFPSMKMANEIISNSGTRQKHVILLADGGDCDDQEGVVPLVKEMARRRITVTAVAIGDGPHVPFLKAVAYTGKGDFYLAQRATDLKAIFTKDVMSVSKSLIIEEPFIPQMDTSSPELSGIDANGVPPLLGYVATSPKSAARIDMLSHKKDPILATWQYGLGKSAAFTPDCKARWSSRWLTWPNYNKFWAQVIRSTMRKSAPSDYQTTVDVSGGVDYVTIDAVNEKGDFVNLLKFNGSVVSPDMKSHPINIEQTGPGRYEATFDAGEVGSYLVNILRKGESNTAPEVTVADIPYPPEYKDIAPNTALLQRLAAETSGAYSPNASDIFAGRFRKTKSYTDLWQLLALLAALLLPIDIAVRRLSMSSDQAVEVWHRALEYVRSAKQTARKRRVTEEKTETVSTLLDAKKGRKTSPWPKQDVDPTRLSTARREEPRPAPKRTDMPPAKPPEPTESKDDMTSRLLDAKRRARGKSD